MNFYQTMIMIAAIKKMTLASTFLRDRYFPTAKTGDIFPTEKVLVEYKSGNKKMAPCVLPRKKGITIEREGYKTEEYSPPYIAPQRPLTIDDLNLKGFGEQLFSNITPQQREASILGEDLLEFDRLISTREEFIAAQAMLNNGYVLKHYADKYGSDSFEEFEMRFYDGENNPSKYTTATDWDEADADILGDLKLMIRMLTEKGLPATDLVVASDVADAIINNKKLQALFDNRNINIGSLNPIILPAGASHLGRINVYGKPIDIFSYDETYEDEDGSVKSFIPSGNVILTAPASGRGLYGAVTQIEESDKLFHTYLGKRVPKYTSNVVGDIRTLKVTSRPLFIPRNANPWVSACVINP